MSGLDDGRLITAFHEVVLILVVSWMKWQDISSSELLFLKTDYHIIATLIN